MSLVARCAMLVVRRSMTGEARNGQVPLSFVGFLVMLGAALTLERNARQVGRTGLRAAVGSGRATGLRDAVGGTRARVREQMRDRFRRGDQGRT